MTPLDVVSALTQVQAPAVSTIPTAGVNFQQIGATVPGGAIGEGFQNLLPAIQVPQTTAPLASVGSAGGASTWGHMVQQMVLDVNSKQETAAQKVRDVIQ